MDEIATKGQAIKEKCACAFVQILKCTPEPAVDAHLCFGLVGGGDEIAELRREKISGLV